MKKASETDVVWDNFVENSVLYKKKPFGTKWLATSSGWKTGFSIFEGLDAVQSLRAARLFVESWILYKTASSDICQKCFLLDQKIKNFAENYAKKNFE
jgi:hypothetical protein